MILIKTWYRPGLLLLAIVAVVGCGQAAPDIIPVTGTVMLNGKPLANAEIKFIPMREGLDGNYIATGVTDSQGNFTLTLPGKTEPGCCACECKVLVVEGPVPGQRGQDERSILAEAKFRKSLKNRPIPSHYERVGTTPLSFFVSENNHHFDLELKR